MAQAGNNAVNGLEIEVVSNNLFLFHVDLAKQLIAHTPCVIVLHQSSQVTQEVYYCISALSLISL